MREAESNEKKEDDGELEQIDERTETIERSGLYVISDVIIITMNKLVRAPDARVCSSSTACFTSGLVVSFKVNTMKCF